MPLLIDRYTGDPSGKQNSCHFEIDQNHIHGGIINVISKSQMAVCIADLKSCSTFTYSISIFDIISNRHAWGPEFNQMPGLIGVRFFYKLHQPQRTFNSCSSSSNCLKKKKKITLKRFIFILYHSSCYCVIKIIT